MVRRRRGGVRLHLPGKRRGAVLQARRRSRAGRRRGRYRGTRRGAERRDYLAVYLRGLDHEALVELLVERAAEDDLFGARLRMAAARTPVGVPALDAFRHALAAAFETDGFVGYR